MTFTFISIISMWVMILGVGCYYFAILPKEMTSTIIINFSSSLFVSILVWFLWGYVIASYGGQFFGKMNVSVFSVKEINQMPTSELINILFQLCFCLYSVVMFIGSVIDRVRLKGMIFLIGLWVLGVYSPLVYWFWSDAGWLNQQGVLDSSGGMVVHLSAGISSYVLASQIAKKNSTSTSQSVVRHEWLFLATSLISFGWFGFNAGPVGELNQQAIIIVINTFIAILFGSIGWVIASYLLEEKFSSSDMLNGIIVGLVGSTSAVGYVTPVGMMIITFFVGLLTCFMIKKILNLINIQDVVDSFGMNGVGGALGSLGTAFFATTLINPQLVSMSLSHMLFNQILGILVTLLYAGGITWLLCKLLRDWL